MIRAFLAALVLTAVFASSAMADTGSYLDSATWPRTASYSWVKFDSNGIPMTCKGPCVYNPVTISEYGLQEWTLSQRDHAIAAANWLVANQNSNGAWEYHYDFPVGGMKNVSMHAPWISAMAQGVAMSLLTRAYSATQDYKYFQSALDALSPFNLSVADGGVVADFTLTGKHLPYYEEYPTDPPSFTLNGFMFSLIGLHDLMDIDPDDNNASWLFQQGFATLVDSLHLYDTPSGLSIYHLGYLTDGQPIHTSLKYHHVHIVELGYLNSIKPNATLAYYHDRWANYLASLSNPSQQTPATTVTKTVHKIRHKWYCSLANHRIRHHGNVTCYRAKHVIRHYLLKYKIHPSWWHCHGKYTVRCSSDRANDSVRIYHARKVKQLISRRKES